MRFFSPCGACKKRKLFIRKASVKLPTGQKATSKEMFCTSCFTRSGKKVLESNHGG